MEKIMLRAIIKRNFKQEGGEPEVHYETVEFESPEIEKILRSGGRGEGCYDVSSVFGIEIVRGEVANQ
jgi:hypothetical protein